VALEMGHLNLDQLRVKHGNGSLLEGMDCTTVEVATARTDTRECQLKLVRTCVLSDSRRDVF
jgi:hypothetical protein